MALLSKILKLSFFYLLVSGSSSADDYGNVLISRVTNVYDGDTFRVDIDHWPALIGKNTPIRINNIDTPEIRGHCAFEKKLALKAKNFTQTQLQSAKIIELKNIHRGKYFRIAADVFLDGVSLGDSLLIAGLARRYQGKTKQSWC
jgi:endonuclease YncB( thermonuclease family)